MKFFTALLLVCLHGIAYAQLPNGFVKFEIGGGLNPTDLAIAADGRVFITEKDGLVRIVENDILLPDPFLILPVEDFNEQGLGHIALHPDFPNQPFVYLYYTVADPNGLSHNRVSRFTADGHFAEPGSEVVLYECDPSFGTVHNGGDMVFGTDGKLYISTGDKARSADVQSITSDFGKVLRINPDGSIPSDNPYYAIVPGKYRAIYALGFRNPFSMAVQPETGRIFISDVGGSLWEEVNELQKGKNYGWPILEGKKTNQDTPSNYADPLYAYDHNTGCSVIGATFSPQAGGNLPAVYRDRFFFADYCQGYIKMMDTYSNPGVSFFATSISRPVGLAFNDQAQLYFLARAGIGGGSEEDNTESENGSIWKVIYTGSEAPFIFAHPKSELLVAGENYPLNVQSLGRAPLHYRWQKNGLDLPASDTNSLVLTNVSLSDSNAVFRCIVSNPLGDDTSNTATLRVTSNQRPMLTILQPAPDFLYHAGSDITFSGVAVDPETGALSPLQTYWKIDFHHDEHLHPVMTPTAGLDEETVFVPSVGEADDQVWYRFHFSATDPNGLTQTTFRDVYPKKIPVDVQSNGTAVPVDADGFFGLTPYQFNSVAGLQRNLRVPGFIDLPDSVYFFNHWDNDATTTVRQFTTPDSGALHLNLHYQLIQKANGFGLLGEYFKEAVAPWDFSEALLISRIDSTVNFEWQDGTPEPGYVPNEGFTVRWTGQVVPYVSGLHTFYTFTDDGARLWVNDSLLVDKWQPQGGTEHSGTIWLEAGKRYPIEFNFLELGGYATAKLLWSIGHMPQQFIPKSQLYPPQHLIPNHLSGLLWVDSDLDGQPGGPDIWLKDAAVLVLDSATNVAVASAVADSMGRFSLPNVPAGSYRMQVFPPASFGRLIPAPGLNPSGISAGFTLLGDETRTYNFSFYFPDDQQPPWANQAWSLLPNPTRGVVRFKKQVIAFHEHFDIRVYTVQGKLCFEKTLAAKTWETDLDLSQYPAGIYLVKAGNRVERVVKY